MFAVPLDSRGTWLSKTSGLGTQFPNRVSISWHTAATARTTKLLSSKESSFRPAPNVITRCVSGCCAQPRRSAMTLIFVRVRRAGTRAANRIRPALPPCPFVRLLKARWLCYFLPALLPPNPPCSSLRSAQVNFTREEAFIPASIANASLPIRRIGPRHAPAIPAGQKMERGTKAAKWCARPVSMKSPTTAATASPTM
jgi:hypothetical protein